MRGDRAPNPEKDPKWEACIFDTVRAVVPVLPQAMASGGATGGTPRGPSGTRAGTRMGKEGKSFRSIGGDRREETVEGMGRKGSKGTALGKGLPFPDPHPVVL